MTTTSVVLIVSPSLNMDGRKSYSTRGQLFDGEVDGREIVTRSATPFCDAARALLADDVDPATVLRMRHAGANYDALRCSGLRTVRRRGIQGRCAQPHRRSLARCGLHPLPHDQPPSHRRPPTQKRPFSGRRVGEIPSDPREPSWR
jgi:hypothetical protein